MDEPKVEPGEQKRHDVWYQCLIICLTVITFIVLSGSTFLSFYAGFGEDSLDLGLFERVRIDSGGERPLDFRPASFTFYIVWPVLFLFQWGWLMYVFSSMCRRNQFGPVFVNPPIITPFFLWVFNVGLAFSITWIFTDDRDHLIWSFIVLTCSIVFLFLATWSCHKSVAEFGLDLQQYHRNDLWALRILLLNGLAFFLTWVTVAFHLTLGSIMSYEGDIDQELSSTILFGILATITVVYFILENFVWEKYLRYTYAFYIVAFWALIGIFSENFEMDRNGIFSMALLIVVGILGLTKLVLSIVRSRSQTPMYETNM